MKSSDMATATSGSPVRYVPTTACALITPGGLVWGEGSQGGSQLAQRAHPESVEEYPRWLWAGGAGRLSRAVPKDG